MRAWHLLLSVVWVPAVVQGQALEHLDLQRSSHLADVDHHGLFIDFGTPARLKYTNGGWKTGWGADAKQGATEFTYVQGTTARVYFQRDAPADATLRFRMRAFAGKRLLLFLNNKPLPSVRLDRLAGFVEHEVPVTASKLRVGENQLLLRFGGTRRVAGRRVSAAMDWLQIAQPSAGQVAAPSRNPALVRSLEVAGQRKSALVLQAPTRLSFYLRLPTGARLRLQLSSRATRGPLPTASVLVTPAGRKSQRVLSTTVQGEWKAHSISLERFGGQVIRLDLVAQGGSGSVAWSEPRIVVAKAAAPAPPPTRADNVIVLLIDTLRADKLRAYRESSPVQTPALDQVAAESVLFEQAQAPENWTKPSVASVLTGLHPATHRTKTSSARLPRRALMVSEVFKQAGLATASFIANGYVSNKFGFKKGWDHYTNYIREHKRTEAENVFREAGAWIEANKDRRFFAYVQTIDPHVPYDPPARFLKLYDPRPYRGQVRPRMTASLLERAKRNPPKVKFSSRDLKRLEALHDGEISYHDHHLARFIAQLKKLGLYDRSLFVVTSDHGEEFADHGSYGHGHSLYQELLHVPLTMRLPGVLPAGRRIKTSLSTLDIAPTILSAAGVAIPDAMEGHDRMAHMRGALPFGPQVAFSDFLDDRRAIRAGRWKLVLNGTQATLFDLEADPGEKRELSRHQHPVAMRYCRIMLGQFLGAKDRRRWWFSNPGERSRRLESEETDIDPTTREQLRQLGYAP